MNEYELERYSRQLLLANFDVAGQMKLAEASVLVIGLGGLGNIAATYLATSGFGRLLLADGDLLEVSNLPRQVLYDESQVGTHKVIAAAEQILQKNPTVKVETITEALSGEQLEKAVKKVGVILDCTDNFTARKSINRACLKYKKPLVSAAAIRWEGQLVSFLYHQQTSLCYECLYPSLSDQQLSCNESGILSPVVGLLGVYQALEAIKLASGCGEVKHGALRLFDGFSGQWRTMQLTKDPQCLACSVENQ
ncbi:molybdopterin-synthase adenylyltransferase MoeB [Marinomonas sp. C2222]|uniref:Molybdopterin-synthase adenylyltransferase MoeB n=1 Tax=Marinomonas sargassi TaxID=2984494 RepID=A0ABT2YV62_9GAMM|nr:molybdopterin-synthase adenylyltransferase MoeB [Marinomonas sargassi]MCV2403774.1 molybdopterin-synthase adenylyltransferase MoeB [Marinomonas sargassi]